MKLLPLVLSMSLCVGCEADPEAAPAVVSSDAGASWWEVGPTNRENLRSALLACLSIIRDEKVASDVLSQEGWSERTFPEAIADTEGTTIFEHSSQSEFIALSANQNVGPVCSVISSANHEMLTGAVDEIPGDFSNSLSMTPHGQWWTADGIRIDNDYANMHVFTPLVFNPDDFRDSKLSDIRIYRCKEFC